MTDIIRTHGLAVSFGPRAALTGINWTVPRGAAVGLVGRNGSGKSTLLRVASGEVLPTFGDCQVAACDSRRLGETELNRVGYLDQGSALMPGMTIDDHLRYVEMQRPSYDRSLEIRLAELFELDGLRTARVESLSAGVKQRVALLAAVCHRPELLLLDEPLSAQDPIARAAITSFLVDLNAAHGVTLVIASHVLRDVESVADRITCLDAGRLVCDESLDTLKEGLGAIPGSSSGGLEALFPRLLAGAAGVAPAAGAIR